MQKPCLVVLDVGHGSAAVLHDEGGTVVIDTGGKGCRVKRHLAKEDVTHVQTMILSHADSDHVGGAETLLMNKSLRIGEVLLNPDSSKNSAVFEQLCLALAEANLRTGTQIKLQLTTSTEIKRDGANIEILHPSDVKAISGVGGRMVSGRRQTSNSMSAAVRVSRTEKSSVLLGADIEFDCLDEWRARNVEPTACVLVFPHHGGLPGSSDKTDAGLFGFEIARMVSPKVVIFSNHRSRFGNPREEVISAISKATGEIRFACTQLPERLRQEAESNVLWSLHKSDGRKGVIEGSICLEFRKAGVHVCFVDTP